jgi:hypothetical protein
MGGFKPGFLSPLPRVRLFHGCNDFMVMHTLPDSPGYECQYPKQNSPQNIDFLK